MSIGPHDDTLTVATNGGSPTVGLFGSQLSASAMLGGVSGATLHFGTVSSGSTEVEPLTVTNVGLPGTVTVGTTISGPSYSILTTGQNTCLAGIAAGQSCILPVQFAPPHGGLHDELLTLTPSPGGWTGGGAGSIGHSRSRNLSRRRGEWPGLNSEPVRVPQSVP